MTRIQFPDGFEWGAATAAHQIEGGNWNNDWWQWEHAPDSPCVEPSGDACDSWNRWRDDVAVAAELGFTTYRFSIEWSRIEPEQGEWSTASLDHYVRLGEALLEHGIEPVVTFHHFTTPRWLADQGGWTEPDTANHFGDFCHRSAERLAPVLRRACTINEPNIVAGMAHQMGMFPPGTIDEALHDRSTAVFVIAHRLAVEAIRAGAPGVPVGLTLSMADYQPTDGSETHHAAALASEDVYLDAIKGDDFVGIQTYTRMLMGPDGWTGPAPGVAVGPMGYEIWPDALAATIRRAWDRTGGEVPILVTENGIATDDDAERIAFVHAALEGVMRCIEDGIDVIGYSYWSLLDNFEWAFGYRPRFGLVDVDRSTFERRPKRSARWMAEVMSANALIAPTTIGS